MIGRRRSFRPVARCGGVDTSHDVRALVVAEQVACRGALRDADGEAGLPREYRRGRPAAGEQVADRALADLVILAERELDDRRDDEGVWGMADARPGVT